MAKRLLLEILILLLAVSAALFLIEKKYEGFETPVDHMMHRFDKHAKNADVLLLGNSHMLPMANYLDTCIEKDRYVSMAFGGMDIFWSTALVKKKIDDIPQLKTVIFSIDEEMLGYNQSFFRQDQVNRSFYRYTDTLYKPTASDKILARSNFFRANRNTSFLFTGKNDVEMRELLQVVPLQSMSACRSRAQEYSVYRFNASLIDENVQLLSELIDVIKIAGKKIVFVTMPKNDCFLTFRSGENAKKGESKLDSLSKAKQVQWINYSKEHFSDTLFRDVDHLNYEGAKMIWTRLEKEVE